MRQSLHAVSYRCSISTHFLEFPHIFTHLCCVSPISLSHTFYVLRSHSFAHLPSPSLILHCVDFFFEYFISFIVCLSVIFVCWFLVTRLGAWDALSCTNQFHPDLCYVTLHHVVSIVSTYSWEGKWTVNKLVCLIPQPHFYPFMEHWNRLQPMHLIVCKL